MFLRLFHSFKKYWLGASCLVIFCVVGIFGAVLLAPRAYSVVFRGEEIDSVDRSTYQAVFLTNNQIYFGHLKAVNGRFLKLKDAFYIQISDDGTKNRGRLVRLGDSEAHRPTNEMIINRDHILFWENLRADSPIIRSIQSLQ